MGVELACHVLTLVVVVVTCLSTRAGSYVLPDDLVPTRHHHHHHDRQRQQQQQPGKETDDGATEQLRVIVQPELAVMRRGRPVHVNCTATSATITQPPYISFFVSPFRL